MAFMNFIFMIDSSVCKINLVFSDTCKAVNFPKLCWIFKLYFLFDVLKNRIHTACKNSPDNSCKQRSCKYFGNCIFLHKNSSIKKWYKSTLPVLLLEVI